MTKEILLTRGYFTTVDDEDFEAMNSLKWYASVKPRGRVVAERRIKDHRSISLHRLLMNPSPENVIDHINGNALDNRRCNLRECSKRQNAFNQRKHSDNTSGYKGVSKISSGKWRAEIGVSYKRIYIGCFETPELAAQAYDIRAQEMYGEYANLNFPVLAQGGGE